MGQIHSYLRAIGDGGVIALVIEREWAATRHADTEAGKQITARHFTQRFLGLLAVAHGDFVESERNVGDDSGEGVVAGAEAFEDQVIERCPIAAAVHCAIGRAVFHLKRHELLWVMHGQRSQQGGIDDAEDGGVDADAEG